MNPQFRSEQDAMTEPGMTLTLDQRTALRDRDPAAMGAFFEAYVGPLYRYLWRMVGQAQLAEDLTQDTFLQVQRSLDRYDPERPLRPWVYTIATNLVRDHWRSREHQEQTRREDWEDSVGRDRLESSAPGPDHGLQTHEVSEQVQAAIAELPETLRTTFVLRFYQGLSFGEIAELAERSEVAVRKRFSRALDALREQLAHLDPQGDGFLREGKVR
ncbi:MAG: RNA polymerase sigma factor [Planctomycetes bacterium]|nr:RNA polymerase sigma factor [Planctomycetota bacterium]HPF14580.1 RNA polymerase sigma factor [Planctomycetota bacterium]